MSGDTLRAKLIEADLARQAGTERADVVLAVFAAFLPVAITCIRELCFSGCRAGIRRNRSWPVAAPAPRAAHR